MTEDLFKEEFRMNRTTFDYIINSLKPEMKNGFYSNSNSIPIDKRVAIALKVMGSVAEYKEIAKIFGVGKTTVHDCFKMFLLAAMKILVPKHIRIPGSDDFKKIAEDFENKWGYPMAVGAIDGCHFPLNVPDEYKVDYYNYKSFHSVVSIAICDANYKVWFVKSGIPGRTNDSGAFQQTSIYESLELEHVFPNFTRKFGETEVPYHILGDGAFQMKSWLIKPFVFRSTVDPDEVHFNYCHSRARRVIENCFGLVKTRWRRTLKKMEIRLEDAGLAIQVAFALHNICEEFRDLPINNWNDINEDNVNCLISRNNISIINESQDIRNALKNYFKLIRYS